MPRTAPVGWVQLPEGYTIRWRRGDPVAHVLGGQQMDNHGMGGVLDTITVSPSGWTDLAEIHQTGQRWHARTTTARALDQSRQPTRRRSTEEG